MEQSSEASCRAQRGSSQRRLGREGKAAFALKQEEGRNGDDAGKSARNRKSAQLVIVSVITNNIEKW